MTKLIDKVRQWFGDYYFREPEGWGGGNVSSEGWGGLGCPA